ncbi:MAG: flagellar hook protein FlgE [Myxococcota bacterium]
MSLTSSLYIGMSGMRTNEGAIGVIGNNIANLNTIGFKSSRAVFADLLSQSVLGTAGMSQQGLGAAVASVQRLVQQGALLGTNITTDLAVNGDGLFMVENPNGDRFYTRNGQFQVDKEGFMTTVDGLRLQGFPADDNGVLGTGLGDLQVQNASAQPSPTQNVTMAVNLDSNAPVAPTPPFDPLDPGATASFQTTTTVFDSLGNAHQLDVFFYNDGGGNWEWHAFSPTGELDGSTSTVPQEVANGTMAFDGAGNLLGPTTTAATMTYFGADPQTVNFDFGDPTTPGPDSTSNSGISAVFSSDQDGFGPGALSFIEIETTGEIRGTFTNGQQRLLGQVALARFDAPAELNAIGQNLFTETFASGQPAIGAPGSGGRGELFADSLEQSNVDLTNEFTQLILAQRGFQAASRTITTADQMLAEVVNLKQ